MKYFAALTAILMLGACSKSGEEIPLAEAEYGVMGSLGDITQDPPAGWVQVSEKGLFCFYLPQGFVEVPVQPIDSLIRVFDIPKGRISVEYGIYSAGQDLKTKNAQVNGAEVTITEFFLQANPVEPGSKNFSSVHTMHWNIADESDSMGDLFFDLNFSAPQDNQFGFIKKVFGTARVGDECP